MHRKARPYKRIRYLIATRNTTIEYMEPLTKVFLMYNPAYMMM